MTGGLLQLATVGKEDSPLINNPELFHFKKFYLKHTNFSIDQNTKNFGLKKFDSYFEFNIDKNSDLLKDFYFKVDIPYFQIIKEKTNTTTLFSRYESDKVYFDILNSKAFVFNISNDKYFIYPEYLMNVLGKLDGNSDTSHIEFNEILGKFLIEISSTEYSNFYDYNSNVRNFQKKNSDRSPIIKILTNKESLWFNIFFELTRNNKFSNNDFNFNLLDLKNFYRWLSDKIENKLLYDYQYYYNKSKNYQFYQNNFSTQNVGTNTNDVYKYVIIKNNKFLLGNYYINDDLDIDKTINFINSSDLSNPNNQEMLLSSVIFPANFLYYLLQIRYDSSYTNYFYFYQKYVVSTSNQNKIRSLGEGVYSDLIWDNFFNKFLGLSFNNKSKDELFLYQYEYFKEQRFKTLVNIENIWKNLTLKNENDDFNVSNIFTIIYTIAFRYKNYSSFDTVNWNDYLIQTGQIGYFSNLNTNNNLYSQQTLSSIFTNYGNDLDYSLIFTHFMYVLTEEFDKLGLIESLPTIDKKNIQFFYWLRNKISNMIFIRYMRIQNRSFRPTFSNISNSTELINFYYTYVPNQILSLNDIKNHIYRQFFNNSFFGMTGSVNHQSSEYMTISKLDQISLTEYNSNTISNFTTNFSIDVSVTQFSYVLRDGLFYIQLSNEIELFPNDYFEMKVYYKGSYYDITSYFLINGLLNFYIDVNVNTNFTIDVKIDMPVNKYFFSYSPLVVNKVDLDFSLDKRTFLSNKYIDTDLFSFTFDIVTSAINSQPEFITKIPLEDNFTYTFTLAENTQFSFDLFNSGLMNQYSVTLNEINLFRDVLITTVQFNNVESLAIEDTSGSYLTLGSSDSFFIVYQNKKIKVTLQDSGITNKFVITNLDNTSEITTYSSGTYYLEKQTMTLTENSFSFNQDPVRFVTVDTSDNKFKINSFDLSANDLSGEVVIDNRMYHTNFLFQDDSSFILDNSELNLDNFTISDLSSATYYKNFFINFSSSVNLVFEKNYQWTIVQSISDSSRNCGIIPVNVDSSETNFDWVQNKFKYRLITDNNSAFSIVNSVESDFNLIGVMRTDNQISLYNLDGFKKSSDIDFRDILEFNQIALDFNKYSYFIGITLKDSTYIKKKLTIASSEDNYYNENNIYLKIKTYALNNGTAGYFMPDFYDYFNKDDIQKIDLIKDKNIYYIEDLSCSVNTVGVSDFVTFKISENKEFYKKFMSTNNSYYIHTESGIRISDDNEYFSPIKNDYSLQYPVINGDVVTMKILGNYSVYDTNSEGIINSLKLKIYLNDYMPNLLNFTSFYLNDAINRVSDLMDYFIQTPMIIFLDQNELKSGRMIFNNLPINFNKVTRINYSKLDGNYIHFNEEINSNQLIRYKNNLISSKFDSDIYDHKLNNKSDFLNKIDQLITTTLGSNNILDIINAIDLTNNYMNTFLNSMINLISDGTFGQTSKKIYENFKNNNLVTLSNSTKRVNIDKFKGNDFNLYSNLVLDFYNGYDIGLNYQTLFGSGKQLFLTNYKSMINTDLLNTSMLNILLDYNKQLYNQIKYVENNITWLALSDRQFDQSFNDFSSYQNEINNYLFNNSNIYDYELEQDLEFEVIRDKLNSLQSNPIKYFDNNFNELTLTDNQAGSYDPFTDNIKPSGKISANNRLIEDGYSIEENTIENIFSNYSSMNDKIENQFNYLGPVRFKEYNNFPMIENSNLDLSLNNTKNYFFIDDNENVHRLNYNQIIDKKELKIFTDSKFGILNDESNLEIEPYDIYVYDFSHNIQLTDNQGNNYKFALLDTNIGKITNNSSQQKLQIITKEKLRNTHRSIILGQPIVGTNSQSTFVNQNYNDVSWNFQDYDLSGIFMEKYFNYKLSDNQVKSNEKFFTFNTGLVEIYTTSDNGYDQSFIHLNEINVNSELNENDKLNSKNLYSYDETKITEIKRPIFCDNGALKYYNLNSELTHQLKSENTFIYFDDRIIRFNDYFLQEGIDLSSTKNIWYFEGNIEQSLFKTNVNIDLDNSKIFFKDNSEQLIYKDNLMNNYFFFFRNKFHKLSNFINSPDISGIESTQVEIKLLDNSVFDRNNEFYTFKSVLYPGQVNLNPLLETLNAPRHSDDMTYYKMDGYNNLIDLVKENYQSINFIFDDSLNPLTNSFVKPIDVLRYDPPTNTTPFHILKYQIYKDIDSTGSLINTLDSTIPILEDNLNQQSELINDFSFYIGFNVDTTNSYSSIGNIRYHNINNFISSLSFSTFNESIFITPLAKDKIKITLKKNIRLIPRKFYKQQINVEYMKESVSLNNDIIFNYIVDSNYNRKIMVAYDVQFNYVDLQEPLIFEGERESTTYIKCLSGNELLNFRYATNHKFFINQSNEGNIAKPSMDILVEDTNRFSNRFNFMEMTPSDPSSNFEYINSKIKFNEVDVNNKYCPTWDLLGSFTIYKDRVLVDDSVKKLFNIIENFIVYLNGDYYFLEKKDTLGNFIFFSINGLSIYENDIDFYGRSCQIFINLKPYLCYKQLDDAKPLFFIPNSKKDRINAKFGTFKFGEIIEVKNCKLIIVDYDLQFNEYIYKTLNKFNESIVFGKSYFSLGVLNNYSKKEKLVNLKEQIPNKLISKKNYQTGDLLINNDGVIYYNSSIPVNTSDKLNFGFENKGMEILIYQVNELFYYFGDELKPGDTLFKIRSEYEEPNDDLFVVKNIISHIVIFEKNPKLLLLKPNYNNKFIFYKSFQPFIKKSLKFKTNRIISNPSNSSKFNGIIKLNKSMKMIEQNEIKIDYKNSDISISSGNNFSAFVLQNNQLYSFGKNNKGQLGVGDIIDKLSPTFVSETDVSGVISVSCGNEHTLALTVDNKVFSFGENENGQLGINSFNDKISPTYIQDSNGNTINNVISISSGYSFSLILNKFGKIFSTGDNTYGQLGNGNGGPGMKQNHFNDIKYSIDGVNSANLNKIYNGSNVRAIATGDYHMLVLLENGTVFSSGRNNYGQLGIGSTNDVSELTPVMSDLNSYYDSSGLSIDNYADSIYAGGNSSAILLNSGRVLFFGDNQYGQLGYSLGGFKNIPYNITEEQFSISNNGYDGTNCINLSLGDNFSSMIINSGKVINFGNNQSGQLGIGVDKLLDTSGDMIDSSGYMLDNCLASSIGLDHALFLLENGNVVTTGTNSNGASGLNTLIGFNEFPNMIWNTDNSNAEYDMSKIKIPETINNIDKEYPIIELAESQSMFSSLNKDIYSYKIKQLDGINFYRSEDIFFESVINEQSFSQAISLTDASFNKTDKFYVKYNNIYYYPLYLEPDSGRTEWTPSNNFYSEEGFANKFYKDSEFTSVTTEPSYQYKNVSIVFYGYDQSGNINYPIFIDRKLLNSKINNYNSNVTFKGETKDMSGIKYITFEQDYNNILNNLNIDYNSDIIINGFYHKLKDIRSDINFTDLSMNKFSYFVLFENNDVPDFKKVDYIGDLSNSKIEITIPSKPINYGKSEKENLYSINNHLVKLSKNQIGFDINMNPTNSTSDTSCNIFCYYTDNGQDQVKLVNMKNIYSNEKITNLLKTDNEFKDFFFDSSEVGQFYLENYIPIFLYLDSSGVETISGSSSLFYNFRYEIKPNYITTDEPVIIEETTKSGEKIIHYDRLSYSNGLTMVKNDIGNSDSIFLLNMINPIRISNRIVQFIKPQISYHNKINGKLEKELNKFQSLNEFVEVLITTNGSPNKIKDGWLIEIFSKNMILISKLEIYTEIPTDSNINDPVNINKNPTFIRIDNKFYLKFRFLPKTNISKLYLKKINYFRSLSPNYSTFKIDNEPTDVNISNNLNKNWNNEKKKIKFPVKITAGTGGNYFTIENFSLSNIFENSYLIGKNLQIINKGINVSSKTQVETDSEPLDFSTDIEYIWNEYEKSNKISPYKSEPFPSVLSTFKFAKQKLKTIDRLYSNLIFNRSKPLENWTSISFDNNSYYKSLNQISNKNIVIDVSQNITFTDNNNSVLLFEETNITGLNYSTFTNKLKNLVANNFEKYNKLIEIKNTEILIYRYLEENIKNINFWEDPIKKLNLFLEFKQNDYRIIQNCLIKRDELITDSTIFTINGSNISRIEYLDGQYDLSLNDVSGELTISRPKNYVIRAINELMDQSETKITLSKVDSIYQPYFGVNSEILFRDLSNIQNEYSSFISRNINSNNFTKEYYLLTYEKLLIENQWKFVNSLSDSGGGIYDQFNKDFNDTFKINYNFDSDSNYSGLKLNNFREIKPIGFDSYNKIIQPNEESDTDLLYSAELISKGTKQTVYSPKYLDYTFDSSDIFQYKIVANTSYKKDDAFIHLEPSHEYKVDIIDGTNIFNDDKIEIDSFQSNSVNFFSKRDYTNVTNVSLNLIDKNNIISIEKLGILYQGVDISTNNPTSTINFYNDTELIYKDNVVLDQSNIKFDLITNNKISDNNFLIIKSKVGIISQNIDGNKNYIKLTKQFNQLKEIVDQSNVYLILDQSSSDVTQDISLQYSLNSMLINDLQDDNLYLEYDNLIDNQSLNLHVDYEIFGYQKLDIERKKTDFIVYKMVLENDIKHPMYQLDEHLPVNYKIDDNIDVSNIKVIAKNELLVYNNDDNVSIITVKVENINQSNKFVFNDNSNTIPELKIGEKYRFDLGHLSNTNFKLQFSQFNNTFRVYQTESFGVPGKMGSHIILSPLTSEYIYPYCAFNGYNVASLYSPMFVQDISSNLTSANNLVKREIETFDNSNSFVSNYNIDSYGTVSTTTNTSTTTQSTDSTSSSSSYYGSSSTTTSTTTTTSSSSSSTYTSSDGTTTASNTGYSSNVAEVSSSLTGMSTDTTTISSELTIGVKVLNINGINKFIFYDISNNTNFVYDNTNPSDLISIPGPDLNLYRGYQYKFDLSNYSNTNHPLRFSLSSTEKTVVDTTIVGQPGSEGSYVTFTPKTVGNYYVFCSNHGYGMGSIYNPIEVKSNLLNSKSLIHEYKIDRDDPIQILNIDYSFTKYFMKVFNTTKYKTDSIMSFVSNINGFEIPVTRCNSLLISLITDKLIGNNLLIETSTEINSEILSDYNFNIVNDVSVNDFSNVSYHLTFLINDDLTFLSNQSFRYSISFDSSLYHNINIDDIDFSGNIANIDLNNVINTFTNSEQNDVNLILNKSNDIGFKLRQTYSEAIPLIDPSYNQSMFINLNDKYLFQDENKQQNISIQVLDHSANECGNYIYKFQYNELTDSEGKSPKFANSNFFYKHNNATRKEIKYLGIIANFFYFSSVDILPNGLDDNYRFYNDSYSLSIDLPGNLIQFETSTYVKGTIIDVSSNKLVRVICQNNKFSNLSLDLNDPLSRFKIYAYKIINELKIKSVSKSSYSFPYELEYSRFSTSNTTSETINENIVWNPDMISNFFKLIKFFINDQQIDIHDPDSMKIAFYHYNGNLIKNTPTKTENGFQVFIPTSFWFSCDSQNYLPMIAMDQSTFTVKIDFNKINTLINNDLTGITSTLPTNFNLTLITDNIILDSDERKKFAEYNHEYIIERNLIYSDKYSLKHEQNGTNIHLGLKGLIKDLFFIFRSQKTNQSYIELKSENEYIRDEFYLEYYNLKQLYDQFIANGRRFTNSISTSNLSMFLLFDENLTRIASKTPLVVKIQADKILSIYDIEFVLYLYYFSLKYIDNNNTDKTEDFKTFLKLNKIKYYFNNVYKNEIKSEKINPIKNIRINANGRELFSKRDTNYYNYVVPYEKFAVTPEDGINTYSFSLHPREKQPSGHLNFNILQDSSVDVDFDENTINENIKLKTLVREYQILRILGGIASLSWK